MATFWRGMYLCLALLCVISVCKAQTLYEVRDLGEGWWPHAISNNRIVVGDESRRSVGGPDSVAVIWRNGHFSTLPVPEWYGLYDATYAHSIDDTGDLICGSIRPPDWRLRETLLWYNENAQLFEIHAGEVVNSRGQIAGDQYDGVGPGRGFLINEGEIIWFGATDDLHEVSGINNTGQVVGTMNLFGPSDLFLWDEGEIFSLEDMVQETVPFLETSGIDINDRNQIVGTYLGYNSGSGSFLYDKGHIKIIGSFLAAAINESAQVVGGVYLYEHDTEILTDLNGCIDPDAGWHLDRAIDINDEGVILGRSYIDGNVQAFMLIPCEAATYFHDNDGDGYGDPRETQLACDQPDKYVETEVAEELIINSAMEGDSNWNDWETPLANDHTEDRVYRGNYARYLSADSPYDGIQSETFHLRSGETYRATLRVYGNGSAPLRALVYRNGQNFSQYKPNDTFPIPPAEWTRYSWTFTPTTSGDYAFYVELAPEGTSGDFYIDDVSVTRSVVAISDCNDNNDAIHPDAREICNGIDDDCDGDIDEGVRTTFYQDGDGDGYGNLSNTRQACTAPQGYIRTADDCDDANENVHPDAEEVCNSTDDDCDGTIDEGVTTTYYRDGDDDGYGDAGNTVQDCSPPDGYVAGASDCDDTRGDVHPTAAETCNGLDDDCDGDTDEGVKTTFYRDVDGDGYGNIQNTTEACAAPSRYVITSADCDDTKPHIFPNAVETCNGVDDDCDGDVDEECIVNELPVADAGNDQQVFEGDTVTLDGSGSMDSDDAIDTWQWVQIDGPLVVLSNEEIARPTFITPVVADESTELTFRLVITDLKGALATDEVRISVAENDISGGWIPDDAITMRTADGKAIGFKILVGGSLVAIREVVSAALAANGELPNELIYGPLWLKIRTTNTGDNVKLACYFQEPIADTHTVYVLSNTDEWVEPTDQEDLSTDRTEFEADLVNGGSMDEDGEDNHFIATTIAIGGDPERDAPEDPGTGGSSGSGGGGGGRCFVQSLKAGE